MLRKAYQRGIRTAIKEAQDAGILGKITEWADENPSVAAGLFSRPLLNAMQTVQQVDPGAEQLQGLIAQRLAAPAASAPAPVPTTADSRVSGRIASG
jgi:hypothetical protein